MHRAPLPGKLLGWLELEVLPVIAHAAARVALVKADPMDLQERAELAHGSRGG